MFQIQLKDDFFYAEGTTDAIICLNIDGTAFPDGEWTDFPVVVLNWWITAVLEASRKENGDFKLLFMDGPYAVNCHKEGGHVHLVGIRNPFDANSEVFCEGDATFGELVAALIDAATELIRLIEEHQFSKLVDYDKLITSLAKLQVHQN